MALASSVRDNRRKEGEVALSILRSERYVQVVSPSVPLTQNRNRHRIECISAELIAQSLGLPRL